MATTEQNRDLENLVESVRRDERNWVRHRVARYLLDRADQYETACAAWQGLADAAHAMVDGAFADAEKHGELDDADLIQRVDAMAKQAQQPLGCRDPECSCKEAQRHER